MKKIILSAGVLLANFSQAQSNNDTPYNVISPTPESSYKSKFGNTDVNDFKGEPIVNIPLFSYHPELFYQQIFSQ